MPAELLDGKSLAQRIQNDVAAETKCLGIRPKLAVILVGSDPASLVYVNHKRKVCDQVGFDSVLCQLPENSTQEEVEDAVLYWCHCTGMCADAVLVQLPLPVHLNRNRILNIVSPEKDVDCFTATNIGKLLQGDAIFKPCTPSGILALLDRYNIPVKGKKVAIVNRSIVVGMPLSVMLTHERDATVTICHEYSDVPGHTQEADVVITAVGKYPEYQLEPEWVKPGAVVIDVGINREKERIFGDVAKFDSMRERTSYLSPVPGCVGPLTISYLLKNTLTATKLSKGIL